MDKSTISKNEGKGKEKQLKSLKVVAGPKGEKEKKSVRDRIDADVDIVCNCVTKLKAIAYLFLGEDGNEFCLGAKETEGIYLLLYGIADELENAIF